MTVRRMVLFGGAFIGCLVVLLVLANGGVLPADRLDGAIGVLAFTFVAIYVVWLFLYGKTA